MKHPHAPSAPNLIFTGKSSPTRALFASPAPAGRAITAGFSYVQRIGKSAAVDVWFPDCLKRDIDAILAAGRMPGPDSFPAEWAAVRQFELLQEATNYKIYDLDPTRIGAALADLTRSMRGGGYRVTVVTIGSYAEASRRDELEILDRRLQQRITRLINMLYLEEQSGKINATFAEALRAERWDYQTALPHVGATLGARDLFRPSHAKGAVALSAGDRRHRLARHFFDILGMLPQKHIAHDTAIGLQLPEAINENEWIYTAPDGEKLGDFVRLLDNLFAPFEKMSLAELDGRAGAGPELKPTVSHMQGYGDRLNPDADHFYRGLAHYTMH